MVDLPAEHARPDRVRARLVEVAARLLGEHGVGAVTTRAVAQAAGVRAPTIYRLFGDKDGLLDAVAEQQMATYVAAKTAAATTATSRRIDPADDLYAGWEDHVEFGLAHPSLFTLLHDPDRPTPSPATERGLEILRARVHRLAEAGRLRVGETRALELVRAASDGAVLTLLTTPPDQRDPHLADAMYDAVAHAILTNAPGRVEHRVVTPAVALRATAPTLPTLTHTERALLAEWLDRAITGLQQPQHPLASGGWQNRNGDF